MKPTTITFSHAISGYLLYAEARRLSPHTISDYKNTFTKFAAHLQSDLPLHLITPGHIEDFLARQPVSAKTALNYHTGLSALWTWAIKQRLVENHIPRSVDRPAPEKRAIEPYTQADLRAMLACLERSLPYSRPVKRTTSHALPNASRDHAIILLLLDTGLRAAELCNLTFYQLDIKNRRLRAFGKGAKERIIPFSSATGQAIWRYLTQRPGGEPSAGDRIFITKDGAPMDRHRLDKLFASIGRRASIPNLNCHRFRHTFAINFLRNGGDVFSLQLLLGHTTMEMVRTYLAIANADIEANHKRASPVANWGLR
jgi:site-specific recombinase XerD